MKWFGRKSAGRASARPALMRALVSAGFGEWPRSYEAQVREGYLENAVAQRAVRLVAEGVASAPLASSDEAALALVRATSAGQGLLESVAVHLLLHGNAYIELLPGNDGRPGELYALRPERVSVEADARGWPVAFTYRVGAQTTRMPAASIIHIRSIHPLDDHYGLGCLGAASGSVAIHNAAAKWNKALLDNAARPSGALVTEGGEALSPEQFDRLQSELASSFAGSANAGRPMILEGGLRWQSLSLSPADMDFLGLKAAAAREIALAFGVPPMLLGLPGDATYANYREANRALWRQAILPLAGKILDALAQGLRPWFADLALSVDQDAVIALSEDRERLWTQVGAAEFLSLNEKRELVGFEAVDLEPEAPSDIEPGLKFNPWHDPENGQFTSEGEGTDAGGSGHSPAARAYRPPKRPTVQPSAKPKTGGSFGGGGASGSWDKPTQPRQTAPAKPNGTTAQPRPAPVKPSGLRRLPGVSVRPTQVRVTGAAKAPRRVSKNGYDFHIDEVDRTTRTEGVLTMNPSQGRSRRNQREAGGSDRLLSDHGGHYIAREFNGPTDKFNHFAQDSSFNKRAYRQLELQWKNLVQSGKKVRVEIVPSYRGQSKRPDMIKVNYTVDGFRKTVKLPNAKKGN